MKTKILTQTKCNHVTWIFDLYGLFRMLLTKCNLSWENNPRMYEKWSSIGIKYGVSILKQHLCCLVFMFDSASRNTASASVVRILVGSD
jgi:hypothetical protein